MPFEIGGIAIVQYLLLNGTWINWGPILTRDGIHKVDVDQLTIETTNLK